MQTTFGFLYIIFNKRIHVTDQIVDDIDVAQMQQAFKQSMA